MLVSWRCLTFVLVAAGLAACAPSPQAPPSSRSGELAATAVAQTPSRTLVLVARAEMPDLSANPLRPIGLTSGSQTRLFNAGLTQKNDRGVPRPYLAEGLPQLNTDTWRVFPDGRMETTYRLRPNLTWHDGTPLTADDFVFAWRVFSAPNLGASGGPPVSLMEEVTAPDARTLFIRWRGTHTEAGNLEAQQGNRPSYIALPRQLMEAAFLQGNAETFVAQPFWTTEYVGLGPFRVARWENGAFLEGAAFDGHALGRPKIDRVRIIFNPDFNATVAAMLSGDAHINIDDSLRFQQGLILKREWASRGDGSVLVYPTLWRWTQVQLRPQFANPLSLTDPRVRKALSHAVDREALNGAIFEGDGIMTETPVAPNADYFGEVDRASTKYSYDVRRSERLMNEAGYSRGSDGTFTHASFGRFATDFAVFASPQNETEMAIMGDGWRRAGFDVKESVWAANLAQDNAARNMQTGLFTTGGSSGEATLASHRSAELPTSENRWLGTNRGGWTSPEFDRAADAYAVTLDRAERIRLVVQMATIFTEDAAVISLYFNPAITAFASGLTGPKPVVPEGEVTWDVETWEFR